MSGLYALSGTPVPLLTVVTTSELERRPPRRANLEAENHALGDLAQTFAASPRSILQKLADVALELCAAHSAGVSVLENDGGQPVLRWRAVAGKFAPHSGSSLPRGASPCGTVLDCDAVQLMTRPVRHFPCVAALTPAIEEALLIPFHLNGVPVGTIWVVSHDDTKHFDAEDARLLTSLGKFAGAAREVTAALQRLDAELAQRQDTNARLATADRNRDRFFAILGHELRSQLAPTKNIVELLKFETLDVATRQYISGIIDRQVGGMTRLVDDLLDIARLGAGNLEIRRSDVPLNDIIERSVEIVRPVVAARNHTLTLDLPEEALWLEADVMWLSQALQNLIGNAAKYTEPGGRILVSVRRDNAAAVISVSDTGIGIAAQDLEEIFELYVQLGEDRTRLGAEGLGVGLYLVRLLVEAHGGSVQARSAGRGCGSEFIVRLPCSTPTLPRL